MLDEFEAEVYEQLEFLVDKYDLDLDPNVINRLASYITNTMITTSHGFEEEEEEEEYNVF